jgi:hypothetical protein
LILGRDGFYTFGCIPQRIESALAEILCYTKTLILFILFIFQMLQKVLNDAADMT